MEEALFRSFGGNSREPNSELRTRVKRLLDADRERGRVPRSSNPEATHYAFFSDAPPGKGVEVLFSGYEAFALHTALRLLDHDRPQGFAVSLLRRLRPELERHHARILRQNPKVLFDQEAIRRNARLGDLAFDNTDPVLLVVASRRGQDGSEPLACAVCQGAVEMAKFLKQENTRSWSAHELVTPAHALARELSKTEPRKRGRSS